MKSIRLNTRQVRAALDGTMTEIRVPIKPQPNTRHCRIDFENGALKESSLVGGCWTVNRKMNPPYQPGNTLYVRETWAQIGNEGEPQYYEYKADTGNVLPGEWPEEEKEYTNLRWHPSINMPKEAARLFLKVTEVRAEKVQEISADGATNEGVVQLSGSGLYDIGSNKLYHAAVQAFGILWDGTHKNWSENPWVWVIKYEKVEADYATKL